MVLVFQSNALLHYEMKRDENPQVFQFPIYSINVFQDMLHAFNRGFDECPQASVMSLGNAGNRWHKGHYYQPFPQT